MHGNGFREELKNLSPRPPKRRRKKKVELMIPSQGENKGCGCGSDNFMSVVFSILFLAISITAILIAVFKG